MRPIVRKRILDRDENQCRKCDSIENLQIDHIIPLSRGGFEEESNMQVLCRKCNLKKGKGIDIEPYIKLGINSEYIELRQDFPIYAYTPTEYQLLMIWLWERNDRIFGIERPHEYSEHKRWLLYESQKNTRKRRNARSASR